MCGCANRARNTSASTANDHAATFARAAVAADHEVASRAGAEILRKGGNAVDAAVATSFALSVVRPFSCGIGGGGFMVIHFNRDARHGGPRAIAINYRETAPQSVGPDFYTKLDRPHASTRGATAVGVPGTVAGLLYALEHFGTLDRDAVLAPAIRAAEEGFIVDASYMGTLDELAPFFEEEPSRKQRFSFVWKRFLKEGRVKIGDRITLPEQAAALRLIAEQGESAFYRGAIALAILSAVHRDGGPMRAQDLMLYAVERVEPLRFSAFDHTFLTMPPPSSGGVAMAQTLGILEMRWAKLRSRRQRSADFYHLLTESLKNAFADRAQWLGDPAFVDVPVSLLTSPAYLRARAVWIEMSRTQDLQSYGTSPPPPDDAGTSHFSVIDARGNAVAGTETINLEFGSLLAVNEFGFCLNNEMDDFTTKPGEKNAFGLVQSPRNAPAPGKRPLSSMTPTIVLDRRGRVVLVAGASGGPRIITGTLQTMMNVILFGTDAGTAVSLPRVHHQWMPDELLMERKWFNDPETRALIESLESRGHTVKPSGSVGNVQIIRRDPRRGTLDAACDPRKGGKPAGY